MAFTFRAAERARRFDPGRTLARRDDADLPFLGTEAAIGLAVEAMPLHRLLLPDAEILAGAAVHAGILCRRQGYGREGRHRVLTDCVLYLQARKFGLTLLTRNVGDIDVLLQMRPDGRALFYRI